MRYIHERRFYIGLAISPLCVVIAPLVSYLLRDPQVALGAAVVVRLLPLGGAAVMWSKAPALARGILWGWLVFIFVPVSYVFLLALTGGVMSP